MEQVIVHNGVGIPKIGFGTYRSTKEDGYRVILEAIRAGYRHFDTAKVYGNEEVAGAVRESGLERKDFFITSKLDRNRARMRQNLMAGERILSEEDMDKIKAMPECGWSGEHPDHERVEARERAL